ncbi:hypothetical protein PVC01_000083300 [Plasmodium vivax]|uniref:VIR protein n=1 Tax=Plasmodium vivax TaxID=5855 RepID=A0A1G4E811_PLAVI|nr:hypothetical protein PVC01_000083300 [Plasmodium vivax]
MDCSPKIRDDSYNFLDTVEEYVKALEEINSVSLDSSERKDCEDFSKNHAKTYTEIGKTICEHFLKLYKSLPNIKNYVTNDTSYKNDCAFINYWLNFELKKHNKNICVDYIYNAIESQCGQTISMYLPVSVFYNIHEDHLYKIDKLYNLYANYNKLNTIINSTPLENKQELLKLSTKCCAHYNEVAYICKDDNKNNKDNIKFCAKLDIFKRNYEQLYTKLGDDESEISKNFIKLSECGNTNVISTAIFGSMVGLVPLMGVLYKFTPIGQMFGPKNRNITKGHRSNGDEMRNISLMDHESEQLRIHEGPYNIKYQSL